MSFNSEREAVEWIDSGARAITAATGFEVGSALMRDEKSSYYWTNTRVSPYLTPAVDNVPGVSGEGVEFIASYHTHPGNDTYSGLQNKSYWSPTVGTRFASGDVAVALNFQRPIYVSQANGSTRIWDYNAFNEAIKHDGIVYCEKFDRLAWK